MLISMSRARSGPAIVEEEEPPPYGPLDVLEGWSVAFGTAALGESRKGLPVFSLEKDSDDTIHTFNANGSTGLVSTSDVSTALDGSTGFFDEIFDQSGNSADLDAEYDGVTHSGFVYGTRSGKAVLTTPGAKTMRSVTNTANITGGSVTIFAVMKGHGGLLLTNTANDQGVMLESIESGSVLQTLSEGGSNKAGSNFNGDTPGQMKILDAVVKYGSNDMYQDGVQLEAGASNDLTGTVATMADLQAELYSVDEDFELFAWLVHPTEVSLENRAAVCTALATIFGLTYPAPE